MHGRGAGHSGHALPALCGARQFPHTLKYPIVSNPLLGANILQCPADLHRCEMARYLWLLIWAGGAFLRLFLQRYTAWQAASLQVWIDWIVMAAVIAAMVVAVQGGTSCLFFFGSFAFVTFVPVSNLLFSDGHHHGGALSVPARGQDLLFVWCSSFIPSAERVGSRAAAPVALVV